MSMVEEKRMRTEIGRRRKWEMSMVEEKRMRNE